MTSIDQQLLDACKSGNTDEVTKLLKEGANAAYEKYVDGTWGAHDTTNPIHEAFKAKDDEKRLTIIKSLLEHKANMNSKEEHYDWRGCGHSTSALETALAIARNTSDVSIMKLFLENNADPNQVSTQSIHSMRTDGSITRTLLTDAASDMQISLLQCLLEAGADANSPAKTITNNEYGWREDTLAYPLHICARHANDEKAFEAVKLLLAHSAEINAVHQYLHQEQTETNSEVTDPRAEGYQSGITTKQVQETALSVAIRANNSLVVKCLVDSGADVTIPRKFGELVQTPTELINSLYADDEESLSKMKYAMGTNPLAKSAMK